MANETRDLLVTYKSISLVTGLSESTVYNAASSGQFSLDDLVSVAYYVVSKHSAATLKNIMKEPQKEIVQDDSDIISFDSPPKQTRPKPVNPYPKFFADYVPNKGAQRLVNQHQVTLEMEKLMNKYAKECADYYSNQTIQ